jgi:hypothetical protein
MTGVTSVDDFCDVDDMIAASLAMEGKGPRVSGEGVGGEGGKAEGDEADGEYHPEGSYELMQRINR